MYSGNNARGILPGHVLHELRWYLHDECVGLALQAMFLTDAVVDCFEQGRRLGVVSNALVRKRAEAWARAIRSGLRRSTPIPMRASQGADLRMSKRLISGCVTVYLPPEPTVYRHVVADFGDFDETTVDNRIVKNRVISTAYGRPGTK